MTQLPETFGVGAPGTRKSSGLAIASLVCSLVLCCPVTTVIGPLLGVAALATLSRRPDRGGRGLAIAGIIVGVLATVLWVVGGQAIWARILEPVIGRPAEALSAGFAGDVGRFKGCFHGAAAQTADADASAFIDSMRGRYGDFVSAVPVEPVGEEGPAMTLSYQLHFTGKTLTAEIGIVLFDEGSGTWSGKLSSIKVIDAEQGDLTYPPPEPGGAAGADG